MKKNAGFTLIEMLIALVVTMVIMGGAYSVFNSQQRQTTIQTNVSDAQQNVRSAMDFMTRDLRIIGYDPRNSNNFGITDIHFRDISDAASTTGNSFIRFTWDKDEDGIVGNDETIDYGLVNGVTITPGIADLYVRTPNDTTNNGRDVLSANIIVLGLAYAYDDDDDGELDIDGAGEIIWAVDAGNDDVWDSLNITTGVTVPTVTAIDESKIRAVRIWMLAQSQAPDPKYTDDKTYIVGSHVVTPNNHFRHRLLDRTVLCRNMGL